MKNFFYKENGFTILELIIGVAIVSLLASVSIASYQKYIKNAKESEGYIMLRKIVDAELAFAANPIYTNQQGETCRFYEGFVKVESYHEDGGTGFYSTIPPKGKKSQTIAFYGRDLSSNTLDPNASGQCSLSGASYALGAHFPVPQLLDIASSYKPVPGSGGVTVKSEYLEPGYFMYLASRSYAVASETGYSNAYMVQAIADLDGVSPSADRIMDYYADNNLSKAHYTILARGIYIDANGDPKAQPGIFKQREEAYSDASYYSSYNSSGSQSNDCDYLEEVYGIDYCNKYY
ncbi:MAG TPA: prepilin-type N-terminal cleavage/methylation domain-containing protein [Oligoflexia bacterium]|nr:prepilin-type N-terminal cleavage/methylation domain-containing protein [Oligoflexia bacterium]HMR25707.1 prepilin-type N-terminal cleavage/methylation domain-containing protein [Oligoflexia bacterium]